MEVVKEFIRRIYFWLCEIGLVSPEVVAESGTLKYRWLMWLYGNPEPLFATQWPDEKDTQ